MASPAMPIGCESAARGGWLLNIRVESELSYRRMLVMA
jgi:hypothetical protein